jgi:A kinase anchor protein, putative
MPLYLPNFNSSSFLQGSSEDSGKGSVDIQVKALDAFNNNISIDDPYIIYQFEIPQDLCGLLIGTNGHYVNFIKERSNTSLIINRHPYTSFLKICSLEGAFLF